MIEGHEDGVKICPNPGKIEAGTEMKTPTCKKEVREFLGLSRTLENWTPELSYSTKLMREVASKDTKFNWN